MSATDHGVLKKKESRLRRSGFPQIERLLLGDVSQRIGDCVEDVTKLAADQRDCRDDDKGDQRRNQTVLDRGGTGLVL
jgi:hypothetical protein